MKQDQDPELIRQYAGAIEIEKLKEIFYIDRILPTQYKE